MRSDTRVNVVLVLLVLLDLTLVPWAFIWPDTWFEVWHGVPRVDPQAFLARCGANWLAFLLLQVVALWRWRRETFWLAVVAGVRLSDVFTDLTISLAAQDVTLAAQILFPLTGLGNAAVGILLIRSYRLRSGHGA